MMNYKPLSRYLFMLAALPFTYAVPVHSADTPPSERSNIEGTLEPGQKDAANPEFVSQMQARIDRIQAQTDRLSSEAGTNRSADLQSSVAKAQRQAKRAEKELQELRASGGADQQKEKLNTTMQQLERTYAEVEQRAREAGVNLAE